MRTFASRQALVARTDKPHYFQGRGHWWVLWPCRSFAFPLDTEGGRWPAP